MQGTVKAKIIIFLFFHVSLRLSSLAQSCLTFVMLWTASCQAFLSITNSQSLLKLKSIKSVMPSNHLILCRPLLLLPSIFPSIRVFSNDSALCIRQPEYWSFSFSVCPSKEYSVLISFRTDWFDILAVQGTLKSLIQHYKFKNINSSMLRFLYGPILTSIHDYWKNQSFDQTELSNSRESPTTLSQDEKNTDVTPGMQNCSVYPKSN